MSKMIKCKTCGADIAHNAKSCPQCGAKNSKPFYKKWWVWGIALIVIIAVSSNSGNKSGNNNTANSVTNNTTTAGNNTDIQTMYSVGETITTDKFEITINNIQTKESVGGKYSPKEASDGGIYVCVDYEYKNISNQPISSFSCPKIKLKDSNDVSYDSDLSATMHYSTETKPDNKALSDLNPGIKVSDSDVFEISKEEYAKGGFYIVVDADKKFNVKID